MTYGDEIRNQAEQMLSESAWKGRDTIQEDDNLLDVLTYLVVEMLAHMDEDLSDEALEEVHEVALDTYFGLDEKRQAALLEASQRRPGSKGPEARTARVDRKTQRAGGADLRLVSKGRNRIQPSKRFKASTKTGSPAVSRADKVAQRFAEPFAAARRSRSDGKRPRTSNELSAKRGSSTERKDVAARLRIRLQKRRATQANESAMDDAEMNRRRVLRQTDREIRSKQVGKVGKKEAARRAALRAGDKR